MFNAYLKGTLCAAALFPCTPHTWLSVLCKWMVEDGSAWTEMMSAPALMKSAILSSGSTIICKPTAERRVRDLISQVSTAETTDLSLRSDALVRILQAAKLTKWQSRGLSVTGRSASTIRGPMVMLGTKRPSMTSMWIQSAPASSTALTCTACRCKEVSVVRILCHAELMTS